MSMVQEYFIIQNKIQEHQNTIKSMYQQMSVEFQMFNNVVTKTVEDLYKKIDAQFNAKAKLENESKVLKEKILAIQLQE